MAVPDLQAVLATLAQYTQPETSSSHSQLIHGPQHEEHFRSRPQLNAGASTAGKTLIDPATITTWQEGLRCVTKIAAQNRSFEDNIRKMIRDQRTQEMKWYAERQKLKQTQANRTKSSAEAMSILQSLSSLAQQPSNNPATDLDPQAELAAFDDKVYRAQQSMQAQATLELKALGVPYFGTLSSLVCTDGDQTTNVTSAQPSYSRSITPAELIDLQRRMIRHLEDLYRD